VRLLLALLLAAAPAAAQNVVVGPVTGIAPVTGGAAGSALASPGPSLSLPGAALPGSGLAASVLPSAAAALPGTLEAAKAAHAPVFDGALPSPGADPSPVSALASSVRKGDWREGTLQSPVDGSPIAYRSRLPGSGGSGPVRIFVGGMALADSFESYFRAFPPSGAQYALTLRGLPPSPWKNPPNVLDADARDLARMLVLSAAEQGAGKVELVLHSYSAFAFQRMLQLSSDPEVARALELLRGSRVVWLGGTTHWKGSESTIGREFVQAAQNARALLSWIDYWDAYGANLLRAAEINPWLYTSAMAWNANWRVQRDNTLRMAAEPSARLMREHLASGWAPGGDAVRRELLLALERDSRDPGWSEATLRRMTQALDLDVGDAELATLHALGIRLDMYYAQGDQFIPWKAERAVLERLRVQAPAELPAAGTRLADSSGRISLNVLGGDHYHPLKSPAELARLLDGGSRP